MYFLGEIKIYYMAKTKVLEYLGSPLTVLFHTQEFKRAVTRITTCCGAGAGIESIVAGTNITIDNTDPLNPIISASGGGGGGLTGTGTNNTLAKWTGATSLGNSLVSEDNTTVKIGAVGSEPTFAFGVYGTTNGAVITGVQKSLSLYTSNTSSVSAFTVLRSNTSANIAEFAAPSGVLVSVTSTGTLQASALAGTGTRMVVADAAGVLSTQAIPSGGGVDTSAWHKGGDALTVASNFGTTTNFDLPFIANNTEYGRLYKNGAWSFGETASATSSGSAAIGYGAAAGALYSTSIGIFSQTNALGAIALGNQARSNHTYAMVLANKGDAPANYVSDRANQQLYGAYDGFNWQTLSPGTNVMTLNANGRLAIGPSAPNARALLDVSTSGSTKGGIKNPSFTTTERDAIAWVAGDEGMVIWNSTTKKLQVWTGSAWADLH